MWALLTMRTLGSIWWIDHKSVLKTIQEPSPSTAAYAFCLCSSQQSLNNFYKTHSRDKTVLLLQRSEDFHETNWSSPRLTWPATVEKPRHRPVPPFSFTLLLRIHVVLTSQLRSPVRVLDVMGSSWDQALKGVILWKTFILFIFF